jgi:hypothetical protein
LQTFENTGVSVSTGSDYYWFMRRLYLQKVSWYKYRAPIRDESVRSYIQTVYWWITNESAAPGYVFGADLGPSDAIHDTTEILRLYITPSWPQQEMVDVHKVRYSSSYLVL